MLRYKSLSDLAEDERIDQVGRWCMNLLPGHTNAICTDSDPGKADRYVTKLLAKFPDLEVDKILDGPTPGVVSIIVRRKYQNANAN